LFGYALAAFMIAGGWTLFTAWPIKLIVALRQRETVVEGYILGALQVLNNALNYPLIIGGLTGLVVGDFVTGVTIGGIIQLMFLGVFIVGASIPPNPQLATILAVVFVSATGIEVGEVLAIVVPVAVFSQFLQMACLTLNSFFYERFAINTAKEGNIRSLEFTHALLQPIMAMINAVPAFLGVYFGTDLVAKLLGALPDWLMAGMGNLGGILPILGFAMLVYSMNPGILISLFIVGFVLGALALQVPAFTAVVIAVAAVVFIQYLRSSRDEYDADAVAAAADEENAAQNVMSFKQRLSLFWRNFNWFNVASWDVLGGWGFAYQMVPVVRDSYSDPKDRAEALTRHIAFWNTNIHAGALIPGMVASMETARGANKDSVTAESIQGIKLATMGPLAGAGDSLYHATLVPLILALGTTMVMESGGTFGWWFSLIGLIILFGGSVWLLLRVGNKFGANAISRFKGVMDKFTEGAKMTGLLMAGFMVARLANLNFKISYTAGETVLDLQTILDGFIPKLPVLAGVLFIWRLFKKGATALWLIIAIMAFTILMTYFGLL
jgi:mannose/fructose/N-acetylgalactosamine-specific phosphotransferase system component IID/mannose/fructose/N-acetylgalactosamine-specific phosphotransferase system component IIC